MKKIEAVKIVDELGAPPDYFVCSASFEDRCLTTAGVLREYSTNFKSLIFYSGNSPLVTENREKLKEILGGGSEVLLSIDSPAKSAIRIAEALNKLIAEKPGVLLLDTTTFTHEQVLIVIRYLAQFNKSNPDGHKLAIAYNGAGKYGIDATDQENLWLSRGVREIRPVIGFSGRFKTGLTTQLILLVGYENERSRALIEHVEPGILAMCRGKKDESISKELADTNEFFENKLNKFVEDISHTFSDVIRSEMSVVDPVTACNEILKIAKTDTCNVIVCPMNTKISTLGAALAALSDSRIQLMYAEPLEYNETSYSVPDATLIRVGWVEFPTNTASRLFESKIVENVKPPSAPSVAHDAGNLPA
jgi:hypothetical protein